MYQKRDITFCPHLPRFFVIFSSFFRLSFVKLRSVGGGTIPPMAYFRVFSMCQNGIKSDGRRCQKRNRIDTFDDYDRRHTHTFPRVLLGFLHIFPNKKPLSSGFLKGYLIAFSDSHFGITGFTSFGHSISMTTSSDDVGRSATK